MGLFDFLLSDEKKIKKNQRRLTNRDAQPEDREISARWLADHGSPRSLLAMLSRFDITLDHQLKDKNEKDLIHALAAHVGQPVVIPLQAWLKQCRQVGNPLRLHEDIAGRDATVDVVFGLLAAELARDDFKPHKKKRLLIWLADVKHERSIEVAIPFLQDFDEGVRYAAAEVIIAQEDDAGREPLLAALTNPDEDSNRLRVRISEVFVARRWSLDEHAQTLAEQLPKGYGVRDGRLVNA